MLSSGEEGRAEGPDESREVKQPRTAPRAEEQLGRPTGAPPWAPSTLSGGPGGHSSLLSWQVPGGPSAGCTTVHSCGTLRAS